MNEDKSDLEEFDVIESLYSMVDLILKKTTDLTIKVDKLLEEKNNDQPIFTSEANQPLTKSMLMMRRYRKK